MEELTGPVMLALLGGLLRSVPSFGMGPFSDSRVVGSSALIISVVGVVLLVVRHRRFTVGPVRIVGIHPAPDEGEVGQIPGLVVREVGTDPEIPADSLELRRELPRAA